MPGQSRLYLDFCARALGAYLPPDVVERERPRLPPHWPEMARLLAAHRLDRALRRRWIIVPGWYQQRITVAYRGCAAPPQRVPLRGFDVSTWQCR